MKYLSIILAVFFTNICLSRADEFVTDPQSHAWQNSEQVENFLVEIGEENLASYFGSALRMGKIFHTPSLTDWWGNQLRGRTNGITMNMGFSDNIIPLDQTVSLITSTDNYSIQRAALYFAIATHETIHLRDLQFHRDPSYEDETYDRSFRIYFKALQYLLRKYEEYEKAGNPLAIQWRQRASTLAALIYDEMFTYDNIEYGDITNSYPPLPYHNGCVRQLRVTEAARYALLLSMQLGHNQNFDENMRAFDRLARYEFSAKGGDCFAPARPDPVGDLSKSVGLYGAFLRQHVIEVDRMEKGHFLKVTKSGMQKNKVSIEVLQLHDETTRPLKTISMGRMSPLEDSRRFYFHQGASRILIVVSETQQGAYPKNTQELSLSLTHVWRDDNNQDQEAPIFNHKPLSLAEQELYGFYPVAAKSTQIEFSAETHIDPMFLERQIAGLRFHGYKGLKVQIHLPEFDQRLFALYRVSNTDPSNGLRKLTRVPTDYSSPTEYTLEKAEYFFLVSRLYSYREPRAVEVRLDFGNIGAMAQNPNGVEVAPLRADDYKSIGSHAPAKKDLAFSLKSESLPSGFAYSELSPGYNPLTPFTLIELDLKKKDFLKMQASYPKEGQLIITLIEWDGKKFTAHYPTLDAEISIRTDNKFFLLIEGSESITYNLQGRINFELRRANAIGPTEFFPRLLSGEEIKSRFGFAPAIVHRKANFLLTGAHPRGFSLKDSFFQIFEFSLEKETMIRIFKPKIGILRRHYLAKVDEDAFAAGRAALDLVLMQHDQSYFDSIRRLMPGKYVFIVESGWDTSFGDAPFQISLGSGKNPPAVALRSYAVAEMLDSRNRLK